MCGLIPFIVLTIREIFYHFIDVAGVAEYFLVILSHDLIHLYL